MFNIFFVGTFSNYFILVNEKRKMYDYAACNKYKLVLFYIICVYSVISTAVVHTRNRTQRGICPQVSDIYNKLLVKKTAICCPYASVSNGNMKAFRLSETSQTLTAHFYLMTCIGGYPMQKFNSEQQKQAWILLLTYEFVRCIL